MGKIFNIPTYEQLLKIASTLHNELNDVRKDNITIVFELEQELLRQIDEDYFFKNNKDALPSDFSPGDEVLVTILDLKFKFIKDVNE